MANLINKVIRRLSNPNNSILKKIKMIIIQALKPEPKKHKIENGRIQFGLPQVVGDGTSNSLPRFSSRIYNEVKSLREILGDEMFENSLEIGCGYARLTPWIADHSKNHYAIEPEKKLYEWGKKLYPSIKFINTMSNKIPFPDNYFDLVVTWTVLQHITPPKFKKSIEEIKRVIKEKGVLVISEYTRETTSPTTWGHSIQEYSTLFSPKKLVQCLDRKVENTIKKYMGDILKFI